MKKFVSLLLMFVILSGIMPAVYASPCCVLYITNITQENDIVTVNYSYMNNGVTDREIRMSVQDTTSYKQLFEEYHYVSEWNGGGTFTFSSADILHGSKCEVGVYYTGCCDSEYCSTDGETRKITIEGGKYVLKFEDFDKGKLELIGSSTAYISITAAQAGFYNIGAVLYDKWDDAYYEDWHINMRTYPDNNYVRFDNFIYMKAGETKTFSVATQDGSDLSTIIRCEAATTNVLTPITTNLQNTTKLYSVSGIKGLNKINIPKYGMYKFSVTGCEENEKYFNIINKDGNTINGSDSGEAVLILESGSYYINTNSLGSGYAMDVTYTIPEAIESGKENTLASYKEAVLSMVINKPSVVTFIGNNASIENEDNHYSFYPEEPSNVIAQGEYFVTVRNYTEESSVWSFTVEPMESMVLGVASKATVSTRYRHYVAFCAPQDGKYEFDFSKCQDYTIVGDKNYTSSTYYAVDMKKDEWMLIGLYSEDDEVTVRKYIAPTAIALNFNETAYFDYCSGKTYLYSYTPSQDGDYKLLSTNNYCLNFKVYTDDEILYENKSADFNISKIIKMKKDVTVYIEFFGTSYVGGSISPNNIMVTDAYTELTNGQTISLSTTEDLTMCYTVSEEGFYNVELYKTGGSWMYAEVDVNDINCTLYNNQAVNKAVYCSAGEKIYFTLYRYGGSGWCDVKVNISKLTPQELTKDTEAELVKGTYYSFTPSQDAVYTISRNVEYGSIDVTSKEASDSIAMNTPDAIYFNGKAGTTYILKPYENMTATIADADVTEITTDTKYNAGDKPEVFVFNAQKAGYYKIDTSLCNSEIYVWGGDYWYTVSGTFNYMHKLEEGIFPIIYVPSNYNETGTPSSAKLSLCKATDNKTLGVSIDDCFVSPYYNGISGVVQLTVTAPYAIDDVKAGIEYSGEGIKDSTTVKSPEMKFTDIQYIESEIQGLEFGETYTIKPFVYVGDDYENKIYGKEKTFTLNMRSNIVLLESNSYRFKATGRNKFNRYGNEYYFEFTQPESGSVEIAYNVVISNATLYDSYGNRVETDYSEKGVTATLEGGQKYYLVATTYDDGNAEISISSLSEGYSIGAVCTSSKEISCSISGSGKAATLYAAFYDGNRLVDLKAYDNPDADITIEIDNAAADRCKLILVDKASMEPLCRNAEVTIFTQPEDYSLGIASTNTNEINCRISGRGKSAVLYAAFYDGNRLVDLKAYNNPDADVTVEIDSVTADNCKLLLVDKASMEPLCENEETGLN